MIQRFLLIYTFSMLNVYGIDFDQLSNIKQKPVQNTYKANTFDTNQAKNEINTIPRKNSGLENTLNDGLKAMGKYAREGASSSAKNRNGTKTFSCKYSCISDVGLLYETIRNVGSIIISADSYSSAKDKANDIAQKRCKNTSDKHGYKMRGGSADCGFGH